MEHLINKKLQYIYTWRNALGIHLGKLEKNNKTNQYRSFKMLD